MNFTVSRLLDLRRQCAHLQGFRKVHSVATEIPPRRRWLPRDPSKWPLESHLLPKLQAGLRDISGKSGFFVQVDNKSVRLGYCRPASTFRIPPNTRGYLYYHYVPNTPPASAELRFRVITPKDDDSDLSSGSDLLFPDSLRPWSCTLFRLAGSEGYQPVWDFVRQHYLDDTTAQWIRENAKHVWRNSIQMLHYLEQPFTMDMSCFSLRLGIVTPFGLGQVELSSIMKQRLGGKYLEGLNGHVILRFERSPLSEHANSRVLVLRVLKILPPVQGEASATTSASHKPIGLAFVTMKEGELLEKRKKRGVTSGVYAINLDGCGVAHTHKDLNLLLLDSDSKVQKKTAPPP
ncbi:hypothetical protein H0H92_005470 [Tricholoma furcatifolium]|nr:hypothetical protein H0H92_005470 [Tricholoma furcatifolium]